MIAKIAENQLAGSRIDTILNERRLIIAGYGIVVAFISLFFLWGSFVPLSSAAIAPGTVGVLGANQRVQHPRGGVVDEIRASNGDTVSAGDVLLVLDSIAVRARNDELDEKWIDRVAEQLRYEAILNDEKLLSLPAALSKHPLASRIVVALEQQQLVLDAGSELRTRSRERLQRSLDTINTEFRAFDAAYSQLKKQRALVKAEVAEYRNLANAGLVTRSQVFELDQKHEALQAGVENTVSDMKITARRRETVLAEIKELDGIGRNQAAVGADKARREAFSLASQRTAAAATLKNNTIRAPIAGTVTSSVVNTVGGVVAAGETLMEIVPGDGRLIVESRLDPKDRDAVAVGQSASVRFSAFDRRSSQPVNGDVVLISADSLVDNSTTLPYYRTLVALGDIGNALPAGARLVPGMQAEVLIATGQQTLLDYLLAPVSESFNRAMRED